jgi:prevent-host-death family protein
MTRQQKGNTMQTLQLREAKASLSAVIASAQRGQPTIITRHGQPTAMVVPFEAGQRLYPQDLPSLASHLLAIPKCSDVDIADGISIERDTTPLRDIDL